MGCCGNAASVSKAPFISYSGIFYFGHACPKFKLCPYFSLTGERAAQKINKTYAILVYWHVKILSTYQRAKKKIDFLTILAWLCRFKQPTKKNNNSFHVFDFAQYYNLVNEATYWLMRLFSHYIGWQWLSSHLWYRDSRTKRVSSLTETIHVSVIHLFAFMCHY